VSNDDREIPEFDDLDLPDEVLQPGDQTAQPTDDMIEPTEEMDRPAEAPLPEDLPAGEAPTEEMMAPLSTGAEGEEAEGLAEEPAEKEEAGEEEEEEEKGEEEKEKKEGFLHKLRNADPYTVMLAISLAAILMGIFWLFMELRTYNLDIKAEEAKQRVGAAPAVQPGSPSSTATA